MNNIGIFLNQSLKENAGGPSGYLYNLYCGLKSFDNNILFFTKDTLAVNANSTGKQGKKLLPALCDFRLAISYLFKGKKYKKDSSLSLYKMDCIHVHSSEDLWALRAILGYRGRIIFTPHRPEALANEVVTAQQLQFGTEYKYPVLSFVCNFLEKYSYKNADAFIFPSKGAASIYNHFPGFRKYASNKPMRFVYTGTRDVNLSANANDYNKLRDDGKVIFAYIGRHNYIKGYDLLVGAFEFIEKQNAKVVCAGSQSKIEHPKSDNWIELGYIKNANCLMKTADCLIIPNRNTYFDLIIIEALAVGTIVITSSTGGNIDLANDTDGLLLFESGNIESLKEAIKRFLELSDEEKAKMKEHNRRLYETKCSIQSFAKAYYSAINELVEAI